MSPILVQMSFSRLTSQSGGYVTCLLPARHMPASNLLTSPLLITLPIPLKMDLVVVSMQYNKSVFFKFV